VEEARVQAEKAWEEAKVKTEEWSKIAMDKAEELKDKGEKALDEGRTKVAETIKPKDQAAE
jgi:ElaB/YqjD/DUF883 family membrane-anchored ribosome-binding protein